jgi:dihydrofolate reductase
MPKRRIIVNIATSPDGYVARPDGNLDWLTERPAPKGFYGLPQFERSIDAKILGRKTILPTFIGEGTPLLAPRHREVALRLLGVKQFPDGVVQLHYEVQR